MCIEMLKLIKVYSLDKGKWCTVLNILADVNLMLSYIVSSIEGFSRRGWSHAFQCCFFTWWVSAYITQVQCIYIMVTVSLYIEVSRLVRWLNIKSMYRVCEFDVIFGCNLWQVCDVSDAPRWIPAIPQTISSMCYLPFILETLYVYNLLPV